MKYRHIIAIPVLGLALGNTANAGYMPSIEAIGTFVQPKAIDWQFDQRNLSVKVTTATSGGYDLTVTGTNNFTFGLPSESKSYAGTATSYLLTAHFTSGSVFDSGSLNINGKLASNPTGAIGSATSNTLLYSADLTDFGFNSNQASIAFKTSFNDSWSNQSKFTGGSPGEVVYLFDQIGLSNGGHGRLSSLINALDNQDLSLVAGKTFVGVESIATVPLPLPAVLFGTGFAAMLGFGRKGRGNAKTV